METKPLISPNEYVMGRTSEEYQRLRWQAQIFEPGTRRIFEQIGLREGMSCLDVGCGPGEVMRLMSDIVGPAGSITGLDADARLGREALDVLRATRPSGVNFIEADLETINEIAGLPFDVTFGRLILIHLRDPIAMLRKMHAWTKPGGYVVVQECDMCTVGIYPRLASGFEFEKVLNGVMEKAGRDVNIGSKLPAYFVEAGVGVPDGTDTFCLSWPLAQIGGMFEAVYKSVLPKALAAGITTEAESQAYLDELNRAATGKRFYTTLSPLLVGVWKRTVV